MSEPILLLILLAGLSACTEYEGRRTNCWSSNALAFAATDTPSSGCEWVQLGE